MSFSRLISRATASWSFVWVGPRKPHQPQVDAFLGFPAVDDLGTFSDSFSQFLTACFNFLDASPIQAKNLCDKLFFSGWRHGGKNPFEPCKWALC
jgi:hypothetical protein